MRARFLLFPMVLILVLVASHAATAAPQCPISYLSLDNQKPNKLYLYFPLADNNTYPEFGIPGMTPPSSPAHRFDVTELTNYTGNAADLRNAVTDVVADDYCEFNVQVFQTTSLPPTTFARRNTVAIGSDTDPTATQTFGLAQAVDTGDGTAVDFARVWAGTYQTLFGGTGDALNGAKSTLNRWAQSIGGTAAHEGGHNYGESHPDGLLLAPGEDVLTHHIMARGFHYSGEDRAAHRHFSDHEYSILASNVGLSIQTMWNWDFVNPNAETAQKLRLSFLSTKPSIILSWSYAGGPSPWINPAVSGPSGTQVFKGTTYNKYTLTWSTGKVWNNGPVGQVPGGTTFHVGATFSSVDFGFTPDPIIITDATLLDGSDNALALRPRSLGYDAGALDAADSTLDVHFFNFSTQPLILQNVVVRDLPRVLSLNAMVVGGSIVDPFGMPFQPFPDGVRRVLTKPAVIEPGQTLSVPVARLNQRRYIDEVVDQKVCDASDRVQGRDTGKCIPGRSVSLFPGTTMFITAEVVDPNAKHWDRVKQQYVTGPLKSTLFYQVAGRHLPGDPGAGGPGGGQQTASNDPCTSLPALVTRPSVTNSVCTVRSNHVEVETGYLNTSFTGGGNLVTHPQALIRVGTAVPALELQIAPPGIARVSAGGGVVTGTTDVGAGLKYVFGYTPKFGYGAQAFFTAPTGTNGFSANGSTSTYALNAAYTLSPTFSLGATLASSSLTNGPQRWSSFVPSLVLGASLPNASGAFAELATFSQANGPGTPTRAQYMFGIYHDFGPRLQVDASTAFSPTVSTGKYHTLGFGISYYF